MTEPYFKKGDYNVICDYSGRKVKASECRMTWDGFFVHKKYWEPRHPQDFVRAKVDRQSVPIPRPEQEDTFVPPPPPPPPPGEVCWETCDPNHFDANVNTSWDSSEEAFYSNTGSWVEAPAFILFPKFEGFLPEKLIIKYEMRGTVSGDDLILNIWGNNDQLAGAILPGSEAGFFEEEIEISTEEEMIDFEIFRWPAGSGGLYVSSLVFCGPGLEEPVILEGGIV